MTDTTFPVEPTNQSERSLPVLWERIDESSAAEGATVRIVDIVTALLSHLAAWQQRSSTRRHLAGMSDDMLKDVGLSRADAHQESRKPFWKA